MPTKTDLDKPLDVSERKHLMKHEAVIRHGLQTTLAVGTALAFIRAEKLYRGTHKTFAEYCQATWDFKRAHAHRLITASETVAEMSPKGDILPKRETQVRPLEQLDTPEQKSEAWKEAVEKHGDEPTGAQVAEVVQERLPSPTADEPPADAERPLEGIEPEETPQGPVRRDTSKARKLFGQLVRELDSLGIAWKSLTLQQVKDELN